MKPVGAKLARAGLAAVYMLKAQNALYQNDASRYDEGAEIMASIIASGHYSLAPNFDAMWTEAGEFGPESIFESNQGADGPDWNTSIANPWGYGTVMPVMIGAEDLVDPANEFYAGWGFGNVRYHVNDMVGAPVGTSGKPAFFEAGDARQSASINDWVSTPGASYNPRYMDTGLFLRKYAARIGGNVGTGDAQLRFSNNTRIFRYAETLLFYAELVGVKGISAKQGLSAQAQLDAIRTRAGLSSIPVNQENIELERNREFFGEGRRYWDLVRWGKAAQVLTENYSHITPSGTSTVWQRTWTESKKHLPIPAAEVNARRGSRFEIKQNPY
jgi:hypothetical protein